ncbi:hypothetical protein CHUAL_008506 [Chamberlinius hualienensis]
MILNGFKFALLLTTSVFLSEANVIGRRNSHGSYANFDAFTTIQGEWFNVSNGALSENTCGGVDVASYLINDRIIGFYDVDFGSDGASDIFIQYSNGETASGTYGFELFIDYPTGNDSFAKLEVQQTGSYCAFLLMTIPLPNSPTGINDLGAWVQNTCGGLDVASYLVDKRVLGFFSVDFGPTGASAINIKFSNGESDPGTYGFDLFDDYPSDQPPLASSTIYPTGSYCTFAVSTSPIDTLTNIKDIYFRFKSPSSKIGAMNLDSFSFTALTVTRDVNDSIENATATFYYSTHGH